MNLLDFVSNTNAKTEAEVKEFRRRTARAIPDTFSEDFFSSRFNNPFFGYVEAQCSGCYPFYMLTNNDDLIAHHYLWYGKDGYFPNALREWAGKSKRASVVFDIGSYTGVFSLVACLANPHLTKVVAFEPLARANSRLYENLNVNHLIHKVYVERYAISAVSAAAKLYVPGDDYQIATTSSCCAIDDEDLILRLENCTTVSIDDYISKNNLIPDLIKIDVVGSECEVLMGARDLIERKSATFFVRTDQKHIADIMRFFVGYQLATSDDAGASSDLNSVAASHRSYTVIAVPIP